ncbi:hypothetical protein ASG68_29995 [Rhizobium sp. Leaf453]|nr:hypothetical protein ASG50_28185 [Rhizobium sp. Leaf386]KQS93771.1 hypothetical protein ASG42_30695 [Rhizobium sp. Leaf391]KQT98829.1 hypothetical protein ASG68_29995 [Rhizobium sp. Leaf453]
MPTVRSKWGAVHKPIGKLPHLVFAGTGGFCLEPCYEVLVSGIASKYSEGYLSKNGGSQDILERVYRLGSGDDCTAKTETTSWSIENLQQRGIFDVCVLNAQADEPLAATVLRGFNYDNNVLARPFGLGRVMVIQAVNGGMLGTELLRWESGSLPGSRIVLGSPFLWQDLIRAYTGISKDRFSDAKKLGHSQRVERVFLSKSSFLRFHPVFDYLRQAPDAHRFRLFKANSNPQKMSGDDITKLKAIGNRICMATPVVRRDAYGAKSEDCVTAYNQFVRSQYPGQADALILDAR